jgi:hypothetical protein
MPSHKRSEIQIEKDREKISEWYLQGWSQRRIAAELRLSQNQIKYDLKIIQARWLQNTMMNLDEAKSKEVAKLYQIEKQAHEAWERSQNDFKATTISGKTVKIEIIDPETGEVIRTEEKLKPTGQVIHTETRPGDPRFLDQVNKCIERRCKLLGLDAPGKQEHTGKDGGPILVDQFKGWTTEDIAKYAITGVKPADIK